MVKKRSKNKYYCHTSECKKRIWKNAGPKIISPDPEIFPGPFFVDNNDEKDNGPNNNEAMYELMDPFFLLRRGKKGKRGEGREKKKKYLESRFFHGPEKKNFH
jgi:hypothetical protein